MHAHAALNRLYRLVWSALHQTWVVASELARGRGKSNATSLISAALLVSLAGLSGGAGAAPQGGQVVSGSGSISASGATTTITQASDKLSINWQSFNVAKAETVNFVQPSASALAVNRILDTQGSQILGKINANGQVWLINPNGVLFGKDAQINVGALVASTLNPDDASIGSARSNFSGSSTAGVVNLGQINAAQGGYVALLGHSVSNFGQINAPGGTVALGAGSAVSLNFAGSKLLGLEVTSNQVNALTENGGLIQADGGQVLLSAGARESLLASVVNNTGIIQARTVQEQDGKIVLMGGMASGTTNVAGTLDASAPSGGDGGFIETSAYSVKVDDSAKITTASAQGKQGQWLIDPYDFYIAASGGNITGAALSTALNSNDVTIQTRDANNGTPTVTRDIASGEYTGTLGDIYVNDAISWSSGRTLTLNAWNSIYINSAIDASGGTGGKLALMYSQGTNTGSYSVNAPVSLQAAVATDRAGNFSTKVGSAATIYYTVITSLGSFGDQGNASATNSLQGLGHSSRLGGNFVLGADINASGTSSWNPTDGDYYGFSPIGDDNKQFTGTFDGLGHTITGLTINRSSSDYVGLFGYVGTGGVVKNVGLSGGSVTGGSYIGGLAGYNAGTISGSYAAGYVSGNYFIGGLVGHNQDTISSSYALGTVRGSDDSYSVGGLVGHNHGTISSSYAMGDVNAGDSFYVGGLVGTNNGEINTSYATGGVTGMHSVGGLVGGNDNGTISNSYFDKGTTGQDNGVGSDSSASGVTGLTTANAFTQSSYENTQNGSLDFTNTWYMVDGATRPFLRSEWSTTVRNTHQLQLMAMPDKLGSSYTLANNLNLTADLANSSSMWKTSDGFSPIGDEYNQFTGTFNGNGHTITGLTIKRPTINYVGLFGSVGTGGAVQNVGLVDANVIGRGKVGGLAGSNEGDISNSYAMGRIRGSKDSEGNDDYQVGGLVGHNKGTITSSSATADISGVDGDNLFGGGHIGGLVGGNDGTIINSHAAGNVTGFHAVGGLVGHNKGTISGSHATGSVTGGLNEFDDYGHNIGGLVGWNDGTISASYATGKVTSGPDIYVGGLVGQNEGGTISSSYFNIVTTGQTQGVGLDSRDPPQSGVTGGWNGTDFWAWSSSLEQPTPSAPLNNANNGTNSVTDTTPLSNSAALTPTRTTSFVPVITPTPLPSNTSFVIDPQFGQNTRPFSSMFESNTLSPAGAETGEETTEKTQENGEENASRPTGSTGMLNTKATGL